MSERDGRGSGARNGGQDGRKGGRSSRRGRGDRRPDEAQKSRNEARPEARTVRREPPLPPLPPLPTPDCAICGQPITDLAGALAERVSKAPAHFDCVMANLMESESPGPDERMVYLGAGSFALIEQSSAGPRFTIKKRIQYEERDSRPDWRRECDRSVIK